MEIRVDAPDRTEKGQNQPDIVVQISRFRRNPGEDPEFSQAPSPSSPCQPAPVTTGFHSEVLRREGSRRVSRVCTANDKRPDVVGIRDMAEQLISGGSGSFGIHPRSLAHSLRAISATEWKHLPRIRCNGTLSGVISSPGSRISLTLAVVYQ